MLTGTVPELDQRANCLTPLCQLGARIAKLALRASARLEKRGI